MDYKDIKTQLSKTMCSSFEEMFGTSDKLNVLKELFTEASFAMLSNIKFREFVGTLNNMSDNALLEVISDPETKFDTIEYDDLRDFTEDLRTIRYFAPIISELFGKMGEASEADPHPKNTFEGFDHINDVYILRTALMEAYGLNPESESDYPYNVVEFVKAVKEAEIKNSKFTTQV